MLPREIEAAVVVTIHVGERSRSRLPEILGRACAVPVHAARDGERLGAGRVLVAPPGRHLLVRDGVLRLSSGPRVNRQRPSIDVMLAGAASWSGPRTVAVVLSGVLDDGAVGAALVDQAGGTVLTQADAEFPSMPLAALAAAQHATAVPTGELGARCLAALADAATTDLGEETHVPRDDTTMATSGDVSYLADGETTLTRLACPECGGALARADLPRISYFACHVGHRYSPQTLAAAQAEAAEAKLWAAVAALEEHAALLAHLQEAGHDAPSRPEATERAAVEERARRLRDQARSWSVPGGGAGV